MGFGLLVGLSGSFSDLLKILVQSVGARLVICEVVAVIRKAKKCNIHNNPNIKQIMVIIRLQDTCNASWNWYTLYNDNQGLGLMKILNVQTI